MLDVDRGLDDVSVLFTAVTTKHLQQDHPFRKYALSGFSDTPLGDESLRCHSYTSNTGRSSRA